LLLAKAELCPGNLISFHLIQRKFVKGPASGRRHPAKILLGSEEVFEPIVVTHDPVNNLPTATHDLRRQHHNEVQKATELHPDTATNPARFEELWR
jgi:hypothetical protein